MTVLPRSQECAPLSRREMRRDITIDVAIQQRLAGDPDAALPARAALVDEFLRHFLGRRLSSLPAVCGGATNPLLYSVEHLRELRQLTTVVSLSFQASDPMVGVVALGVYLLRTTSLADGALKWLADRFRQLWSEATASFQGIADALAAGDFALAGQVLWASLKLQWQKGVAAVNKLWEDAKWYFFATWQEATSWLAEKFIEIWAGLKSGFVQTVAFLTKTWHGFVMFAGNAWNAAQKQVGAVFLDLLGKLGVLSEQEVGWAKEDMGRELDAKMADRTRERTAAMAETEAERQKDLERIRNERTDAISALEDDKRHYYDKLNAAYAADLASAQEALDAAKAEWESSLEAVRKRKEGHESAAPGGANGAASEFGPFNGIAASLQKVTAAGTFSAFGARGLSAGGPEERTARATEETARNTKRLLDAMRDGGLAFE